MNCHRWVKERGECKYVPNHTECKGNERDCKILHDPFQTRSLTPIEMFRAMNKMYEQVTK